MQLFSAWFQRVAHGFGKRRLLRPRLGSRPAAELRPQGEVLAGACNPSPCLRARAICGFLLAWAPLLGSPAVLESARRVPVAYEMDVVVVGGSTGAVAAAAEAASKGVRVLLITPKPYLGEDMCATLRLWREEGEALGHPLAARLFAETAGGAAARPMHIKKTLDEALLAAGVEFHYNAFFSELLRDGTGAPAGIVMANPAGRQAVPAKVIVDATDRAIVARMAGARFRPYPSGRNRFTRVVIGGAGGTHRVAGARWDSGRTLDIFEHDLSLEMPDDSFASFVRAEHSARDLTYDKSHKFEADESFQVPPDPMHAAKPVSGPWNGPDALDLQACRPDGVAKLWVLSGAVDIPRDQAARLLRPPALIELGARIGAAAAGEARSVPAPRQVRLSPGSQQPSRAGDVRESLNGVGASSQTARWIDAPDRPLPVLGEYDVVVVGGGTGGAPAGIAAARQKARTVVLELLPGLGGHGTYGGVAGYYWGYRRGFTAEAGPPKWQPMEKAEWWRRTLRSAGGEAWFGVLGCGALVKDGKVAGVVVATPHGRGVLLAKAVVDSTGNADIAAAAGAPAMTTGASEVAVQGASMKARGMDGSRGATFTAITDLNDMLDVRQVYVVAKQRAPSALDLFQTIGARERRRTQGDFVMSFVDQMNRRTYPDTVSMAYSNFDTHGFTVDPYFLLTHPDKEGYLVRIPYRCLTPRGVDGVLVTGVAISVHRDALPLVRMQADVQNLGYAAGVAAAMAAQAGIGVRAVDVRALQKHLVDKGNLPASVLEERDSYPLPISRIREAVATVKEGFEGLAAILAQPDDALPMLRKAYADSATSGRRLVYARILAVLGDNTGLATLAGAIESGGWDPGWNYESGANFIEDLSPMDSLIISLGRTRDRRALPPILKKAGELDARSDFSHHRAVALALESIGDSAAAGPLAQLLLKPGMQGYSNSSLLAGPGKPPFDPMDRVRLLAALRELSLARALYRCGDKDGIGRTILESYSRDLRGHFARHASAVLELAGTGGGQ